MNRVFILVINIKRKMRIYIRHGDKAYDNGHPPPGSSRKPAYDPPLTHKGKKKAVLLAEELLKKYPIPTRIITSPYLRARQTAIAMASVVVKKYSPCTIAINYDRNLSEYLGNHRNAILDVTSTTAKCHPPHPETFKKFRDRVKRHYTESIDLPGEVIWIITHGIIIKEIIREHYTRKAVPYLGYITVESKHLPPKLYLGGKSS